MVKYYYAGGQRVAMRKGSSAPSYLLGAHLGSTSVTAHRNGALSSSQRDTPWGGTQSDSRPTSFQYTGQRKDATGLYFYNARYYDPYLNRFLSPDTIVPDPTNPQSFNRYSYVYNNPLAYIDPDGHDPIFLGLCIMAVVGMAEVIHIRGGQYVMRNQLMPIYNRSASDAEFLANVFTDDQLPNESASGRWLRLSLGTSEFPFGNMRGSFGDEGFQTIFQDGGDQVGHFLTAANFGFTAVGVFPPDSWYLRLAVGHEIVADGSPEAIMKQIFAGNQEARDLFSSAVTADAAGDYDKRDSLLQQIYDLGGSGKRQGNSLEDLRLTVRGWRFGQMLASGDFKTREEAAAWLKENILAP